MAETIQLTDDQVKFIYLPLCSVKGKWNILSIPDGVTVDIIKISKRAYHDLLCHTEMAKYPELEKIFDCYDAAEVLVVEANSSTNNESANSNNQLVVCNGCDQRTFEILPDPSDKKVCDKSDYVTGIFYTRVWLSTFDLTYLNNRNLLDADQYYKIENPLWPGWYHYPAGLEDALKFLFPYTDVTDAINAIAHLIITRYKMNPTYISIGCGIRVSMGPFVKDEIIPQGN